MRYPDEPPRRRRRWPVFAPLILVLLLAGGWTGFWFYASAKADSLITAWREREAKAGRVQTCGSQGIGGFPFRLEVRCDDFGFDVAGPDAFTLGLPSMLAALQVYDPALLIAEFSGPMTIKGSTSPARATLGWRLAQSSLRASEGLDYNLLVTGFQLLTGQISGSSAGHILRTSVVLDDPNLRLVPESGTAVEARAQHIELHGRPVPATNSPDPAIETILRVTAAVAPDIHPLMAEPVDAEITALVSGVTDIAPKPWPARLREWQGHGGNIEITQVRIKQGDVIAVGAGVLDLTPRGNLNGQLQLTLVGLDQVLRKLGVEQMLSQGKAASTINALDRLVPGLGAIARQNAAPGIIASLGAIGQNTTLEGKPAVTLPLRFNDGAAYLGPIPLGRVQPLF